MYLAQVARLQHFAATFGLASFTPPPSYYLKDFQFVFAYKTSYIYLHVVICGVKLICNIFISYTYNTYDIWEQVRSFSNGNRAFEV